MQSHPSCQLKLSQSNLRSHAKFLHEVERFVLEAGFASKGFVKTDGLE